MVQLQINDTGQNFIVVSGHQRIVVVLPARSIRMVLHPATPSMRPIIRHVVSASRSFSSTPAVLSNKIPPESPAYIRLPPPPQSDEAKAARIRGALPVPREIFPRAEGSRKLRPDYILKTAPLPKTRRPTDDWKATMANNRRKNLQQGLKELWKRQNKDERVRTARAHRKFEENQRLAAAPEREDDRITRGTVLDAILDTKVYPDPDRFLRADRSRSKTLAKETTKREARRDSLMELYINASNFIVQESELKAEIENIFSENFFRNQSQAIDRHGTTENAWGVYGKPPGLARMMEQTAGTSTKVMDYYESEHDRSVKRQKRIAEEFTGGKME